MSGRPTRCAARTPWKNSRTSPFRFRTRGTSARDIAVEQGGRHETQQHLDVSHRRLRPRRRRDRFGGPDAPHPAGWSQAAAASLPDHGVLSARAGSVQHGSDAERLRAASAPDRPPLTRQLRARRMPRSSVAAAGADPAAAFFPPPSKRAFPPAPNPPQWPPRTMTATT